MAEVLRGACLFGQSGGPTTVINASAAGVFHEALRQNTCITHVLGAAYGVSGILQERFYDMSKESAEELELLKHTPSSALGSVRYCLKSESDLERVLDVFRRYNIRYFFYNGGNDSMDTCCKISHFLTSRNYACRVIGIPKTIDNDLMGTDHCPGYGSAAKFVATSIMNMHLDANVYQQGQVTVVEIMGRDAGWLTAASALASPSGLGPHLILLPECVFEKDAFVRQVKEEMEKHGGSCLIAVSEGIRCADGKLVAAQPALSHDTFGHPRLGGVAAILQSIIQEACPKVKAKSVELNILQRCYASMASATDVEEAYQAGIYAVQQACQKQQTGMLVSLQRRGGPTYEAYCTLTPVDAAANAVKKIPASWILPGNKGLTEDFHRYAAPLICGVARPPEVHGLPRFAQLKKVPFVLTGPTSSL